MIKDIWKTLKSSQIVINNCLNLSSHDILKL
ncbi:unnamed protein product [Spirodela intermedia]|uniref:Uncharacterized protein n=1 Tax=Spirodela intermedia TaxID=51605 RepID=A0A7I8KUA3_SPIIN|nr:unnamed protein product [Spirodela intermedia]